MKGLRKIVMFSLLASLAAAALGGCGFRSMRGLSKKEVLESVKKDFGITVEREFAEFEITRSNELKLLYYDAINEKLAANGDMKDGIRVIYVKTDDGEHKFIYYVPHLKEYAYTENYKAKSVAKDGIVIADYPFQNTLDDIYEKTQQITDAALKERLSENLYSNFKGFTSFYSIVKNQRIRYVFDNTYFFVFGTNTETYMVIFGNELYVIENQRCIYPRDMSIAEMIILFDNK